MNTQLQTITKHNAESIANHKLIDTLLNCLLFITFILVWLTA